MATEITRMVTEYQWHFIACSYDGENLVAYVDQNIVAEVENKNEQGVRTKPAEPEAPLDDRSRGGICR